MIYGFIPGANAYFMGYQLKAKLILLAKRYSFSSLSIVMGISQFGGVGILLGPLAVGLAVTMKDVSFFSYFALSDFPMRSSRLDAIRSIYRIWRRCPPSLRRRHRI